MKWKPEYETGIGEIDSQHQIIMQLVTEFEVAVDANAHWSDLHPLITRAREYAKFHFAVEESLMQIFNYPRFSAHRAEHSYVLKRVAELEGLVLKNDMMDDLVPRFRTWLLGHFLDSDRQFVEFMRTAAPMMGRGAVPVDEAPVRPDADALEKSMRRAVDREAEGH
jgi:hemerythrin